MRESFSSRERTLLVHVFLPSSSNQADVDEFRDLAQSAGASIVGEITAARGQPDAKYFVGSGKVSEIQQTVTATQAELVIFNQDLSPGQERNLEKAFNCRVIDRQGLILDIFAQRARTFEGKLQVELALLQRLSTRLIRGWTHLERQKGGIGLRGPGETQLETDRRLIRERIKTINARLDRVKKQRHQNRTTRQRAAMPTVALVGYTNAGKSSLFNKLTAAGIYVADQLFATLDPTARRTHLPAGGDFVLIDTVGFISHLPHELVQAFSATLEETREADLLLHVIDLHQEGSALRINQVNEILQEIDAGHIPQLLVYNKIDQRLHSQPHIEYDANNLPKAVWLSAATGVGLDLLYAAITAHLYGEPIRRQIVLDPSQAPLRAKLYQLKAVERETVDEEGQWLLHICLSKKDFEKLFS